MPSLPEGAAPTPSRKADHLRINIEADVRGRGITNGFERYALVHRALPEIDFADVNLATLFLGRPLRAPILISCMTGGTGEATRVNRTLAAVAAEFGFAMGLGSARVLRESPQSLESFDVRAFAPDALLLANLGAVQLNLGWDADDCRRLLETLKADALALHLNPLQEALQPEGDTRFSGLLAAIARLCRSAEFPVLVKEVGWGIGGDLVRRLFDAGVAAVDVAGAGGTSWSEVERHRIAQPWLANAAAAFAGWGSPTAQCLVDARAVARSEPLIASGGIADGIDAVKALALGADLVGIAGPFLRAADRGAQAASDYARELVHVMRVAAFAAGARTAAELRAPGRIVERA